MAINYTKYLDSTGTHYIANSGHDENNRYHGGQAGDQTGHEAELKAWYYRPWTVVLRYPDPAVGLCIAKLEIAMCLNNKIGYDQYQRTTYWQQLVKAGYDPSAITTACEQDCTGGTTANVKAAGHLMGIPALEDIPTDTYSGNMRARFVKAGFKALTGNKYLSGPNYLLPGDVLLYEGHHAAVNITVGAKVRDSWSASISMPKYVRVTAAAVNVRNGPGTEYGILGVVLKGAKLPYQGQTFDNGWHLVEYKGKNAAISGKYTEVL